MARACPARNRQVQAWQGPVGDRLRAVLALVARGRRPYQRPTAPLSPLRSECAAARHIVKRDAARCIVAKLSKCHHSPHLDTWLESSVCLVLSSKISLFFFSVHRDACGSLFVTVDLTGLEVHICGLHTCLVLTPSPALPEPWQPGARLTSNPPALDLYGRGLLLQPYPNAPPSARTLSLVARHTLTTPLLSPLPPPRKEGAGCLHKPPS
ncbi:hypothetical protein B0T26DRAFT_217780 [Lasiosphaeria miniovina]|uniref:Uncharacterized protein n=1 Tax=Lasiosphaeria miniovina TaxID=1954250 RepID=A0AA40AUT7_9PEZI|nr:uncharacterized protein B0T26DRAFT_217780 [Lasiosphaeria miniovina]KAK0722398.1 hypothetical protein B0T26DRAFT_217780 [Lasiosphaeria miniovina]